MLSLYNVGGSNDAGKYYEKTDDYYTKDRSPSQWLGKGAEAIGLQGEVGIEEFKQLLDGNLPNGEVIQAASKGRRGGTDMTFSAPKSVSMQAFIGGDLRLIDAHDEAVKEALEYAEANLMAYRQTQDGKTERVLSGNLLAATFRHELSRACDPDLHTHAVVLNMTQRKDGKWRAMDNELIYRQKMLMGAMYRASYARKIQELGYGIRVTREDGLFELSHITDQAVKLYSQRGEAIEAILKENGLTRETATAEQKQIATIATRPQKTDVDREILKEYWLETSKEAGINFNVALKNSSTVQSETKDGAKNSLNYALDHLTERQSVVTEAQILREALQFSVGKATYSEIKSEMEKQLKAGTILRSEDRFTTQEALEREKMILSIEKSGRILAPRIISQEKIHPLLNGRGLNEGQKEAAELILTTNNRIVGVQGLAGTGKTFMLTSTRELAELKGFKLLGLAPSSAAADELSKTGMESKTIALFQSTSQKNLDAKTLLVIDEAGMVSAKQMEFLLQTAERSRCKVVLIGDTQQLKSVEAGRPFAQLQAHGMITAGMSEIQRQKSGHLKSAVEYAAMGEIKKSVALLEKSIYEISSPEDRYARIAKDYTALDERQRENAAIASGTNKARKAINQEIRKELGLEGKGITINILENKDFTKAQRKALKNYRIGDYVKPERNYDSLGLKKGGLYVVKGFKGDSAQLMTPEGKTIEWEPYSKSKVSVYSLDQREVAPNELLRITQNNHQMDFINGDKLKVLNIEGKFLNLQKEDGRTVKLDTSKPLHLEHGYCSTLQVIQGKTCDVMFYDADTKSLTSSQDALYVGISRARHEVKIYTDNKERLPEAMSRKNVKEVALELHKQREPERQRIDFTKLERPKLEIKREIPLQIQKTLERTIPTQELER